MTETEQPTSQAAPARNAALVGPVIAFNSALFLLLGVYLALQGEGWQPYVIIAMTALLIAASLLSTAQIKRGQVERGSWILFTANWIAPLAASYAIVRLGYISFTYIILSSYFIIAFALPRKGRYLAVLLAAVAALGSISAEWTAPGWRLVSPIFISIAPALIGLFSLGIVAVSTRRVLDASLRLKLMIPFGLLAILSFSVLAFSLLTQTRSAFEELIGRSFISHAEDHADQILNFFEEKIGQLQVLAISDSLHEAVAQKNASYTGPEEKILSGINALDASWINASDNHPLIARVTSKNSSVNPANLYLHDFLASFPEQTEVFLTDRYGATIAATSRLSDYYQGDETWWQTAWNNGQGAIYISDPEYDQSAGVTALLIAIPVFGRENEVIGILRSTLIVDALNEIGSEDVLGETGHSVLFDKQGNVIFDPRANTVNSAGLPAGVIQEILDKTSNYRIATDQNGTDFIFGHANLETEVQDHASSSAFQRQISNAVAKLGWTVMFRQEEAESFQVITYQTNVTIVISIGLVLAFVFTTMGVTQLLLRPISNLKTAAEMITSGNRTIRARVESRDEIGQLAAAFNSMTTQLEDLIGGLEDRVSERTVELEKANLQVSRRVEQFEAIAQVSRTISTVRNIDELLPRIAHMISQYFGFYHVGIFLIDETGQFAELRATNSEGGQRMLARGHKLRVGQVGIVGYVTETGNHRIALDVGADAVFFDNPDLTETRSEMALPLKYGEQIIGALDVQSTLAGAFAAEDANILSILADQVSTVIQNARLFKESREALAEAETAYQQLTRQAWSDIRRQIPLTGYRFDGDKPEPLTDGHPARKARGSQTLSIPVRLRGVTIGKLQIRPPAGKRTWTEDEIAISQAIAERVAIAAENARLIAESQKRAAKEQIISEISAEIGASVNLDNILQTAVRQMGRFLPGAEVSIQVRKDE
ncbi:MAG: GAF domain-containing protein [Chloroflexota bacterium]